MKTIDTKNYLACDRKHFLRQLAKLGEAVSGRRIVLIYEDKQREFLQSSSQIDKQKK